MLPELYSCLIHQGQRRILFMISMPISLIARDGILHMACAPPRAYGGLINPKYPLKRPILTLFWVNWHDILFNTGGIVFVGIPSALGMVCLKQNSAFNCSIISYKRITDICTTWVDGMAGADLVVKTKNLGTLCNTRSCLLWQCRLY